jgi:hypothetical protein
LHVVDSDGLSEANIRLRDQNIDGRQWRRRLGDNRLGVGAACKIGRNAAGGYGDTQDDNARGLHTLYSLRYSTNCEALQIRPVRGEQQPDIAIRTSDLTGPI